MTWICNDTELLGVPSGYLGFVYLIRRRSDGKFYYGQKGFYTKLTKPPLAGKTRKRVIRKESNWPDYWSSSEELKKTVLGEGAEKFDRVVLRLCKSKAEMNYYEAKYIFESDALLDDNCWNGWVSAKVTRLHLKNLDR